MSRAKGNRLERDTARAFLEADGADPLFTGVMSSAGRVGHLDLGCDVATRRFQIECKCRESLSDLFWQWLDHLSFPGDKVRVLVVRKNRRDPLVVLRQSDFLSLVRQEQT